jgi:hypothetical protein
VAGGSVRKIAKTIGARRTTVHVALGALLSAGILEKIGSDLVLRS